VSKITIYNKANYAINIEFTNGGFVYHYQNSLEADAECDWDVAAVGWDF
jgi:hypothetical protein